MLGGCISSAKYAFKADIYKVTRVRSPLSGDQQEKWIFERTIDCQIQPFQSTSFNAQGTNERFGPEYNYLDYITLVCGENLGRNRQITNIRNADGPILVNKELKDSPPTWYNTQGSNPIVDVFGRVTEWATLLERATVQGDV